jgi:Ca2+-binding RTX toxin-like protein
MDPDDPASALTITIDDSFLTADNRNFGTLTLANGAPLPDDGEITVEQFMGLKFTPGPDLHAGQPTFFSYSVSDGHGGVSFSTDVTLQDTAPAQQATADFDDISMTSPVRDSIDYNYGSIKDADGHFTFHGFYWSGFGVFGDGYPAHSEPNAAWNPATPFSSTFFSLGDAVVLDKLHIARYNGAESVTIVGYNNNHQVGSVYVDLSEDSNFAGSGWHEVVAGFGPVTEVRFMVTGSGLPTWLLDDIEFTTVPSYFGQSGNDLLLGSTADERFYSQSGDDKQTGGGGNDVFAFGGGSDLITDFAAHETGSTGESDRIDISFTGVHDFAQLQSLVNYDAVTNTTVLDFAWAGKIILANVNAEDLTAADVIFSNNPPFTSDPFNGRQAEHFVVVTDDHNDVSLILPTPFDFDLGDNDGLTATIRKLPSNGTLYNGGVALQLGVISISELMSLTFTPDDASNGTTTSDFVFEIIDGQGLNSFTRVKIEIDPAFVGDDPPQPNNLNITGNRDRTDVLYGGPGDDILNGTGQDMFAFAQDHIFGGDGDDVLTGSNAVLDGGAGNDELRGETGFDYMIGGAGDDVYRGHSADEFVANRDSNTFVVGEGHDVIRDFHRLGLDERIDISLTGIESFADLLTRMQPDATDGTLIDLDGPTESANSLQLDHVRPTELSANDFIFYNQRPQAAADDVVSDLTDVTRLDIPDEALLFNDQNWTPWSRLSIAAVGSGATLVGRSIQVDGPTNGSDFDYVARNFETELGPASVTLGDGGPGPLVAHHNGSILIATRTGQTLVGGDGIDVFVLPELEKSGGFAEISEFDFTEDAVDLPFLSDFGGDETFFDFRDINEFVQVQAHVTDASTGATDGFDLLVRAGPSFNAPFFIQAHFADHSLQANDPVTVIWHGHIKQVQAMPLVA